ncbi:ArsR/SmtB family transcription factor [Paractinoplanes abujensis]|uniref:DNA-binding transcriptional ArsR family regulator n=1 Tax=Paractinoplanes abujensis TaxID=882441 RepID=A0A7W7CM82_9ACTN|nr:winged helix-turn-helix domain-containing protein [Actinoplanes abujensis]MBB4691141.1 DNA-binding transcriptional ArsR family regulator [Actinoplanes abujensis]
MGADVLRIHFTPEDVGRVRIAGEPDPMWETIFSVWRLRRPGPELIYGRWRGHAIKASRRDDLELLLPLVRGAYYPDFLTPAEGSAGLQAAIEAIKSTPATRLRDELEELVRHAGPKPSWMGQLAAGDTEILERLAGALRSQYESAISPFWGEARAHVEAERSRRARVLLDQGAEGLLDSFRPMMRWEPPVLEVDTPFDQTLQLDGRGLLLVPSYLSWGTPDTLRDTTLPPVLVYPIEHDLTLRPGLRPADGASLAALIGRTRTALLESLGDGRTTSELARRVGVSAASVSQHTAVLREAQLIQTSRAGKAVVHTLTPLGKALLGELPARP